jgi:putative transposase
MLPDPRVARQNYYKHKLKPARRPETRQLRRDWLTGLIREVHICSRTVSVLMTRAGIPGLPGPVRVKRLRGIVIADDLVNRKFHRLRPNELWVTDITQHRTREGWVYCAAVLDAFSRRIVGWSIDSR